MTVLDLFIMIKNWFCFSRNLKLKALNNQLKTHHYVEVFIQWVDTPGLAIRYLVVSVDFERKRIEWVDTYTHSHMSGSINNIKSLRLPEDPLDLKLDSRLNSIISAAHKVNMGPDAGRNRKRIGYTTYGNTLYILEGLHVHSGKVDIDTLSELGLYFESASLTEDHPKYGMISRTYRPRFGTLGIQIDLGEWEPNPNWIDRAGIRRTRIKQEYQDYINRPDFEPGSIVATSNGVEDVFCRYTTPDKSSMLLYPSGLVTGINNIRNYKLVEKAKQTV